MSLKKFFEGARQGIKPGIVLGTVIFVVPATMDWDTSSTRALTDILKETTTVLKEKGFKKPMPEHFFRHDFGDVSVHMSETYSTGPDGRMEKIEAETSCKDGNDCKLTKLQISPQ